MTDIEKVCRECLIEIFKNDDERRQELQEASNYLNRSVINQEHDEQVSNIVEFCKENHKTQ